jgi:hypothetical protein
MLAMSPFSTWPTVRVRRTAAAVLVTLATVSASTAAAHSWFATEPVTSPTPMTAAGITASLSPDRLGRRAALTLTIHFSGGTSGVPAPVRRATLSFPAGLTLEIPRLVSCSLARLRVHGVNGCPASARVGIGHAVTVVLAGSRLLTESVALTAFLGPLRGLQPTVLLAGQGYSPVERRIVLTAVMRHGSAPYGEQMVIAIPAIPTLPLEPDASLATLSLTAGTSSGRARDHDAVRVPSTCPRGGFPFAGEFVYADGSKGTSLATAPCPR